MLSQLKTTCIGLMIPKFALSVRITVAPNQYRVMNGNELNHCCSMVMFGLSSLKNPQNVGQRQQTNRREREEEVFRTRKTDQHPQTQLLLRDLLLVLQDPQLLLLAVQMASQNSVVTCTTKENLNGSILFCGTVRWCLASTGTLCCGSSLLSYFFEVPGLGHFS